MNVYYVVNSLSITIEETPLFATRSRKKETETISFEGRGRIPTLKNSLVLTKAGALYTEPIA